MRSLVWVWVNWRKGLIDGGSNFRIAIILGTILIWFLVFHVCVPERVLICRLNRNSSKLDRASENRDSVPLKSWDSFLRALSSNLSETNVINSPLILRTDVFRDWPFLGCSICVFLVTAANFRLCLIVAILLEGKCHSVMKTEFVLIRYLTWEYNKKCEFLNEQLVEISTVNWYTNWY